MRRAAGLRAIRGLQQGEEELRDSGSVSEEVYQKVLPLAAARRKRIQSEKLAELTLTVRNSWPALPNASSQPYGREPDANEWLGFVQFGACNRVRRNFETQDRSPRRSIKRFCPLQQQGVNVSNRRSWLS